MLVPKGAKNGREQSNIDCSNVVVTSCDMDVRVFPEEHLLKVKAGLDLSSNKKGMADLSFALREEFEIKKISQGGKNLKFSQKDWQIKVKGVEIGDDTLPLVWEYEGKFEPPYEHDSMSNVIIYSDEIRLTYTSHWYPEPKWSSDEKKKASSRLSVEVPTAFVVVSGDNLERKTQTTDGRVRYQYFSKTHGSLSFAASEYVQTILPWGDKTVEGYFFKKKTDEKSKLIVTKIPNEEEDVLETLKASKSVLDFYSRQFTSYPWKRFALVQKSRYAAYAYGVSTYVVMNNLSFYSERNLAHEIAHQWWGNLIHPVGKGERWLTESLAEYSAFLYMEHIHGKQEQDTDSHDFLLSQMQNMHPIRQTSFDTPNYNNIAYKIGPHVFHMLRYIVSDESFFGILKAFSKEYAYKDAKVDNFIEVAESVYQKDLSWFFEQWLDRTRNPEFVLETESTLQGDNTFLVKGKIIQHNTDFRMPLEIEITGDERKEKRTIWVEGNQTAFSYRLPYQPLTVKFVEEMPYWILADFFNNEEERLAAAEKRPKPRPSRKKEELISLIRNNIKFEQAYKPGTEIELKLGEREGVRLELAENPSGVEEILICPMEGNLYFVSLYSDGGSSTGGTSLTRGEVTNYTRAATIARWEVVDEKVHIEFRAEIDREKIKEAIRERYKRRDMAEEEIERRLKLTFP